MTMRRVLVLVLFICGCVVTQTGNPPLDLPGSDLSPATASWGDAPFGDPEDLLLWEGQGVLRLVRMETEDPPRELSFDTNGELAAMVPLYAVGEWVRVHHFVDGLRRLPVDVVRSDAGFSPRATGIPCLDAPIAFDIKQGVRIVVNNRCDTALMLADANVRSMPSLGVEFPTSIPAGDEGEIILSEMPPVSSELELLLTSADGVEAITLF